MSSKIDTIAASIYGKVDAEVPPQIVQDLWTHVVLDDAITKGAILYAYTMMAPNSAESERRHMDDYRLLVLLETISRYGERSPRDE